MPTGPAPHVSRRQALAQLAAMSGVGMGLPVVIGHRLPRPRNAEDVETDLDFDPAEERRDLVEEPLGWVLIGNSMLNSRIYAPFLNAVSGWTSRKLAEGGTQSAIWWLFFKNVLIASGARPLWVTVFFRESDLTWPDFRVRGKNAILIRRLRSSHEPEWDQVMAGRSPVVSASATAAKRLFGVEDHDDWARRRVTDAAFDLTALEGVGGGQRRLELNELFSLDRLRDDIDDDGGGGPAAATTHDDSLAGLPDPGMYAQAPTVFDPSPSGSFLPHFIALAARHDIRLHFHRVKRRPNKAGLRPDLPMFRRYLDDLEAYVRGHGCAYSDESGDPELTLAWFQDGDHIDKERRQAFAGKFWALVRDQIGPPPPGGGRAPVRIG
ncbi:MAG: hypothetical protein ACKV19_27490 [Verrucomicrobiales bacterium]